MHQPERVRTRLQTNKLVGRVSVQDWTIESLPPEVMLHIVNLGKWNVAIVLAQTCKLTREIVREWQHTIDEVRLQSGDDGMQLLRPLVSAAPYLSSLTKLTLTNFGWYNSFIESVLQLVQHTPKLKYIDLSYNNVDDYTVMSIALLCLDLEYVDVSYCCSVTDDSLMALALQCPNLQSLDCSRCAVSDVGITTLTMSCHKLRSVTFAYCTGITTLEPLRKCKDLEYLDVRQCKNVTIVPSDAWKQLQHINLTACRITDATVSAIARNCPFLKHLNLTRCVMISDHSILTVASSCLQLREICLHQCQHVTDLSIDALRLRSTELTHLGVLDCDRITFGALHRLCQTRPHIRIKN